MERRGKRKKLFQRSYVSLENPWDSRGKFVRQNGLISKNAESITRSTCIPRLTIITITNFRSGLEAQLDRSSSWNIANCNLFPRSLNVSLFQRGNKGSMGKNLYPLVESATESPMCVYIYIPVKKKEKRAEFNLKRWREERERESERRWRGEKGEEFPAEGTKCAQGNKERKGKQEVMFNVWYPLNKIPRAPRNIVNRRFREVAGA